MVWKLSIDLSRPLVPSMGAHDPLDGLLTLRALRTDALRRGWTAGDVALDSAIADMRSMCTGTRWATADPLGIGGLLCDAYRLARLSCTEPEDVALLPELLDGTLAGLVSFERTAALHLPAAERLAFRELGLSLGLHAVPRLARLIAEAAPRAPGLRGLEGRLAALDEHLSVARAIEAFWLEPANRRTESWRGHEDINSVMLAASLLPEGYLD
jgi:hypothetical protein